MYGMTMLLAIFLFSIVCISGIQIWNDTKKRVPEKRTLPEGTHLQTYYRNYSTKVFK